MVSLPENRPPKTEPASMIKPAVLTTLLLFPLSCLSVAQAGIIDQQQPNVAAGFGFGGGGNTGFQSVTSGITGQLDGFEIVSNGIGLNTFIELDVFVNVGPPIQGDPNDFEATVTLTSADVGNFFFVDTSSAGIMLNSGDVFSIGLSPNDPFDLGIGPAGDSYTGGEFYFNNVVQSRDIAFRTHMSAAVPEPSSLGMLLIGSIFLPMRRRRRPVCVKELR